VDPRRRFRPLRPPRRVRAGPSEHRHGFASPRHPRRCAPGISSVPSPTRSDCHAGPGRRAPGLPARTCESPAHSCAPARSATGRCVELSPQPMVAYDRRTLEIVEASNAMVELYGYTREELCSMTHQGAPAARRMSSGSSATSSPTPRDPSPSSPTRPQGYPGHTPLKDGTIIDVEVTSTNLELNRRGVPDRSRRRTSPSVTGWPVRWRSARRRRLRPRT